MDVFRLFAQGRVHPGGRSIWLTLFCTLALLAQTSPAAPPERGEGRVLDVRLHPGGVLRGQVVDVPAGVGAGGVAGLPVRLLHGRRTIAATSTGRHGEFSLKNLSPGVYQVAVERPGTPAWWSCRVWTSATAPPQAQGKIYLPIGGQAVRGQSPLPFPIMSLQQAATVTVITAGAFAAPAIYHNTQIDNRVPSSP